MLFRDRRTSIRFAVIALLLSSLAVLITPSSRAWAAEDPRGHVYVLNNTLSGPNAITVFNRAENGSLSLGGTVPIGGRGSLPAFADGTQGSLILTSDRSRLFAVDAGSNEISVIDVRNGQLTLVGVFPSGGVGPVSLTYGNGWLYVLNAANGSTEAANVAGFRVDMGGSLHPIASATRPLSAAHPNPAQVQIDPAGRLLLVTEKSTNLIDLYHIQADGSLSARTSYPSTGVYPFGMAFNPRRPGDVIVDDGMGAGGSNMTGAVSAYRITNDRVQLLNGPVPDGQIAPCWMVVTNNGRFAYTSNADSHSITGYKINKRDGTISLVNANRITAMTPANTFPLEEALSRTSRYLYVLDSRLLLKTPGPATLSGFRIFHKGNLTPVVDETTIVLPFSAIGLAAE